MVVVLAIQLRHEGVHYQVAMDRAAIISELNHDIRNAILPVLITVQKANDPEAHKVADLAIEQINMALREATADALSRKVEYTASESLPETKAA